MPIRVFELLSLALPATTACGGRADLDGSLGGELVHEEGGVAAAGVCGNAMLEEGEICDDGNLLDGDGCSRECVLQGAWCDGEECLGACGDGFLKGTEQCDDGNTVNGDGCTSTCTVDMGLPVCMSGERSPSCVPVDCGNGIVEPSEECDDGENVGAYGGCGVDCLLGPHCGDGIVQPGYEECDNGLVAVAECSDTCQRSFVPPPH